MKKGNAETSTKKEIIRRASGKVDKHHSCWWMGVIGLSPFIHFTFIVEYSQSGTAGFSLTLAIRATRNSDERSFMRSQRDNREVH